MSSSALMFTLLLISHLFYVLHFCYNTYVFILFSHHSLSFSIFTPRTLFSLLPLHLSSHNSYYFLTLHLISHSITLSSSVSFLSTSTLSSHLSCHYPFMSSFTLPAGVPHRNHPQAHRDSRTNAS